ncbi:MAG: hypothetical protein HYT62_00565 [Candidatus Yanofskybacteria bacterium]|nr:hypothetical protein [Candidatus Yanofskybacteria bacterium]
MDQDSKIINGTNFSLAKAVLAVLWQTNEVGREKLFGHKYIKILCHNKHKGTYRSCISRLCGEKLIKKDYNDIIGLTELGRKAALFAFIEAEARFHKKDQKWDGGWRIVFFDIPEHKRKYRDYLRKVLRLVGFNEFQKSIWIYPYPVPSFLKDLMFEYSIKPHVRFITTNLVDNDSDLKRIFGLV